MSAATAATGLGFSIARGYEIGDRGDVLRAGEIGDAGDERRPEADDQDRTDINRQKIKPVRRGEPDRAVVGPGRAIDGETEGIDESPRAPG